MLIRDYPRPLNDTGRGVHWSPSPRHWGQDDWGFWRDVLIETNVKWVKVLHADDADLSAIPLCKRLVDLGIMPVVRFYRNEPMPNPPNINADEVKRFADIGCPYIESIYNEWDNQREWSSSFPKDFSTVINILADNTVREWKIVTGAGGIYVFPAASFGGKPEYDVPQLLVSRGYGFMFEQMAWAIHNYSGARPVGYPEIPEILEGKPVSQTEYETECDDWHWCWEISREEVNANRLKHKDPNASVLNDPTCFRAFEWLDDKIRQAVGFSIPIFGTESGENVHSNFDKDLRFPYSTPQKASQMTYEQFKHVENLSPEHPYFCHCVWLIAVQAMGHIATDYEAQMPWFGHWYDEKFGLNGVLPLVKMLENDPGEAKANGPAPEQWPLYPHPWRSGFDIDIRYTNPPYILEPVASPSQPHWQLDEVMFRKDGSGRVFVRCLEEGKIIEGQGIFVLWAGGNAKAKTKGQIDAGWGDLPVPAISEVWVLDDIPSDKLTNVFEGTVYLTFVRSEGENKLALDVKEVSEDMLASPDVVLPDAKYEIAIETKQRAPGVYWQVKGVRHLLPSENNGNHHCYFGLFDESGNPIMGSFVDWNWAHNSGPKPPPVICDKPYPQEPMGNLPIAGNMEWVEVWMGDNSDRIYNIRSTHPDEKPGNTWGHHSFYVVFQKVLVTETPPPDDDTESPPDAGTLILELYDFLKGWVKKVEQWENG